MRTYPLLVLPLTGTLLLAGCALTDPYERYGVWHPNHANDTNLAAMVAAPSDLVRGVADDHMGNGQNAATAVDRQRTEKVYALPDSAVAQIGPTGSGGSGNAGSPAGQAPQAGGGSQ